MKGWRTSPVANLGIESPRLLLYRFLDICCRIEEEIAMVTAVAYTNFRKDLNKKTLRCVNALIRDTMCSPFTGLGKPEPFKWELQGAWSRRIDSANRWCTWSMVVTCASCPCATTTEHWGCGRFLGDYRIEKD